MFPFLVAITMLAGNGSGLLWESRGTLYVTADGGRRWSGLERVAEPELDFGSSAWMLPDGQGFALLGRGSTWTRLVGTSDRGRTSRTLTADVART